MKVKIIHKIYDDCGTKFMTNWNFETKKEAQKELKSCYEILNKSFGKKRYGIVEYNNTTLKYYDTLNKEMNLFYINN